MNNPLLRMWSTVAKTQLGNRAQYSESSGAKKGHKKKTQKCFNCSCWYFSFSFFWKVDCLYFRKRLFWFSHQTGYPLTVHFHKWDSKYEDYSSASHLPCIMYKHTYIRKWVFLRKELLCNANENNLRSRWEDRRGLFIVCRSFNSLASSVIDAFFWRLCHERF